MKYSFYKTGDKEFCNVLVDKSSSNGILKFSHEIDITFVKEGIWKFFSAWHCGVSEMFWTATEEDDFNDLFPGVLKEIKDLYNKLVSADFLSDIKLEIILSLDLFKVGFFF